MKKNLLITLTTFIHLLAFSQPNKFIYVDQFGYLQNAEKVAIIRDPVIGFNSGQSFTPSNSVEVRNSTTNAVAFTGSPTAWKNGIVDNSSGDRGWWFDFSSLKTPGEYYVYDPVRNEQSAVFKIEEDVYNDVLKAATKMFYYNRCNLEKETPYADIKWVDGMNFMNPLQDLNCRPIYAQSNSSLERNLSGGWFDAGDYNKYVTFTYSVIHDLLYAYENNPTIFNDNWNLPESGNGIPDFIDEIKWELDWLLKMSNPDGSVIIKMGSKNYNENTSSPPSNNINQRYYGPTCTSASATVASVLAHATLVLQSFPSLSSYADALLAQAELSFNYTLFRFNNKSLEINCDNGSIVSGDADVDEMKQQEMLLSAAIYLFEKTGNPSYNTFIAENYSLTDPLTSGFWGVASVELQDALIRYAFMNNATPSTANAILTSIEDAVSHNYNEFFGWNEEDLYRAFMPSWSYYWGSNKPKADYANFNYTLAQYNIGNNAASQLRKSAEQLHYFHGVNPIGMVYLSNMYALGGDYCANEIYHSWFNNGTDYDNALTSLYGPAPGFLVGGPNPYYSNSTLSPPYNQPVQKSYLDFNTGYPYSSWEITEPAIYYQASYIRLLSNYASNSIIQNVHHNEVFNDIKIFPNPASNSFLISDITDIYTLELFDESGRKLIVKNNLKGNFECDISKLAKGIYICQIKINENKIISKKIVKN